MRILSILIIFIISISCIQAQNSLSGIVKDKSTRESLPAVLYISDLKRSSAADINGRYLFTNLPSGKLNLEVHMLGYSTRTILINVNGDTKLDILLEETHVELNQVVVTGVSHATEIKRSPIPTVIVDQQYLARNGGTNAIDAISKTPGIAQLSTGAGISKPVIRGLGYTRIITMYDGIRQEGQQWGDEHGIEIDEYAIDRAEILKGPASLMYGSDGIGGVINFIPAFPVPEGKISGSIMQNYQTNNGLSGTSAMLAGNQKGFVWKGRGSYKTAGNYQNKYDGKVFNSGLNEKDVNAYIGLNKAWGFSHLNFSFFDQVLAMPEGERDSATGKFIKETKLNDTTVSDEIVNDKELNSYTINIPKQHITHYRIYTTNNFILGSAGRITTNLGYQLNKRKEYGDVLNPDEPGLYMHLQTFTYDVKYYLPEWKGWDATFGVNGMYQQHQNKGIEYIVPDYKLLDGGIFGFLKKTFNKLDISGGMRFDQRDVKGDELLLKNDIRVNNRDSLTDIKFEKFHSIFNNASGSIGATYNFSNNFLIKANIARGFRAPNIAELASNGKHEGTFRYEVGNTLLNPEISLQKDVGFNFNSKHVSLDVAVFNNNINNYIYLRKLPNHLGSDSIIDPADSSPTYQFIQRKAELYGGEISLDVHPHPLDWLHFENAFSLVYARNLSSTDKESKYLPFIPAPRTRSELRIDLKNPQKFLKKTYLKIEAEHYFEQNRVLLAAKTETPSPAYTVYNAGIGTDIVNKTGNTIANINFLVNNLTDVSYQNHLNRLKYVGYNYATGRTGIFNMGRNFIVKINIPFTLK